MPHDYDEKEEPVVVLLDLETTGCDKDAHVTQIAAKCGCREFNAYLMPRQHISFGAATLTGIMKAGDALYVHGKKKNAFTLHEALTKFIAFLRNSTGYWRCVLVAHKASFDAYYLLKAIDSVGLTEEFEQVCEGFSDTLSLFRRAAPDLESYSLKWLVEHIFPQEDFCLHNALNDVRALRELINYMRVSNDQFIKSCRPISDFY